jgi:hypothetical protein
MLKGIPFSSLLDVLFSASEEDLLSSIELSYLIYRAIRA